MRTLVQLSDLHFGRVDAALLDPLVAAVHAARPDVVVVSGDLTQRARRDQFRAARDFLDRLPRPQVVVPGNHDVPLYDVLRRFAAPLARFRHDIEPDLAPFVHDHEIAVLGLNTARALTFKNGRVNAAQLELMRARFAELPAQVVRIVVTHHPFELPPEARDHARAGRAELALQAFGDCGVDLLLSGHLHRSHAAAGSGHGALLVQAGTASSTRVRDHGNAFNVIRVDGRQVAIEVHAWQATRRQFAITKRHSHRLQALA